MDRDLHLKSVQNLKFASELTLIGQNSILFPDLNVIVHLFSRSGKLALKFPHFFSLYTYCVRESTCCGVVLS